MPRAELYVGELLMKMVARQTGEISKVDFTPQKPAFSKLPFPDEKFLERSSPESQGVSSAFFTNLIRDLSEDRDCKMHKFMALRHGKVIAECAFEPFEMDMWHVTYSMCKSITGMAIGILMGEGKLSLDDRVSDIFSSRVSPLSIFRKTISVRNLLNMSSGIEFNEAGAISGNDWRKSFLDSSFKFDPGTKFEYNSMNSYMLSAIVTEITGQSLFEFCKERLFDPMGIKRVFWESCPQSITKGGWGMFMRIEDMAKMGQLYLQKGNWEGQQLVPEEWVIESTSWQIETGSDDNAHYGYQLWINDDRPGSFAYNGMMGQNVFVYPDLDMVVVTNAGNADVFQTSSMAVKIRDRMKNDIEVFDTPLPEDFKALTELKAICKSVSGRTADFPGISSGGWKNRTVRMTTGSSRSRSISFSGKRNDFKSAVNSYNIRNQNQLIHTWLKKLDGQIYDMEWSGVGLCPIMMQVVHNNFTDGIKKVGFRLTEDNAFFIDVYEGDVIYRLRCGFGGKRYISDINVHSENYKVSLNSFCTRDEYNRLTIRNDVYFLEEACLRTFNIYFENDAVDRVDRKGTFIHPSLPGRIEIRMFETPGSVMLHDTLKNFSFDGTGWETALISRFVKGGLKEAIQHAVNNTVEPVIYGRLEMPDFGELPESTGDAEDEALDAAEESENEPVQELEKEPADEAAQEPVTETENDESVAD
ncbi:MAG: serine hydrolase [Butyrivibrio sp.]|nr:serine hydrolase [Butyrivibrio sp.]